MLASKNDAGWRKPTLPDFFSGKSRPDGTRIPPTTHAVAIPAKFLPLKAVTMPTGRTLEVARDGAADTAGGWK
jgi:hypothetical protein